MWSSVTEIYPIHLASVLAPAGGTLVVEPQVAYRLQDYRPVITKDNTSAIVVSSDLDCLAFALLRC